MKSAADGIGSFVVGFQGQRQGGISLAFREILRQIVAAADAIEHDETITIEEQAALALVGFERFDRLRRHSQIVNALENETR